MALAPSARMIPIPAPGMPLRSEAAFALSLPSSTRATSFSSTTEPSGADFSSTFSNCSTVCSLLRAVIVALSCWSGSAGRSPSLPADTCVFCAWMALAMSDGISAYFSSLAGSIQIRMA